MNKFTDKDVNVMSWNEYGEILERLYGKITAYMKDNNFSFDALAPIIRSGGVTGNILAVKLKVTSIIPLQLKYFREPDRIDVLIDPACYQNGKENSYKNILLCETNTVKAYLANKAVKVIRHKYPLSRLFYATIAKVFGGPDMLENIEEYFYGTLTDEKFRATGEEMKKYNIRPGITVYPWENIEDELNDIYSDDVK